MGQDERSSGRPAALTLIAVCVTDRARVYARMSDRRRRERGGAGVMLIVRHTYLCTDTLATRQQSLPNLCDTRRMKTTRFRSESGPRHLR